MPGTSLVSALLAVTGLLSSFCEQALADHPPYNNSIEYLDGAFGPYPRQTFLSHEAIAPVPNVLVSAQDDLSPSRYILWTPAGVPDAGLRPMILDATDLSVVWYAPLVGAETLGATVQTCNDTEYITFWTGEGGKNWKAGLYYLLNENYEIEYNVTGHGSLEFADAHELTLTPQCTAIFTGYQNRREDQRTNGDDRHFNLDSLFQEIDVATGQLLFHWNASQHIDTTESYWDPPGDEGHRLDFGWDWFHINSVQKDLKGNYLVSSRHCHTLYYVSGETGEIIWRLGGKNSSFTDLSNGTATDFAWQHHARFVNEEQTQISIFDNGNWEWHPKPYRTTSRGVLLSLDYDRMEVSVAHEYVAPNNLMSFREGSMQVLRDSPSPNNVLLGFGNEAGFTEYSENGTILWDVAFSPLDLNRESPDNYRALKVNWTGHPLTMPDIAPGPPPEYEYDAQASTFGVRTTDRYGRPLTNDSVYVSWNGATEVQSWAVFASNESTTFDLYEDLWADVPKRGFESSIWIGTTKFVAVLAIGRENQVMGASRILDMRTGEQHGGLQPQVDEDGRVWYDLDFLTDSWREGRARKIELDTGRGGVSAGQVMMGLVAFCGLCFSVVVVGCVWRGLRPRGYEAAGVDEDDDSEDGNGREMDYAAGSALEDVGRKSLHRTRTSIT